MVDESGSGLGGMRVWAHDSAVTYAVLLVPHGPQSESEWARAGQNDSDSVARRLTEWVCLTRGHV
eukprot:7197146-Prymnesium_polylepis.1